MSKKLEIVLVIICVLALGLSATALVISINNKNNTNQEQATTQSTEEQQNTGDIQYVLYVGTNDKDTNQPVYSPEEAKEKLKEILINDFGGYTIQEANGGWKDGDTIYQEYTMVVFLSDTSIEDVHKAADEMIKVFNQSSILIQSNNTVTEFYSGE